MAGGTLAVPNDFAAKSGNVPAAEIDSDFSTVETYVNNREIGQGTLALRPAAGTRGQWYFATDTNGGTLYADNGSSWVQVAPALTISKNLSANVTAAGTGANTTETVLQSYAAPASTLSLAGQKLVARAVFTTAANPNIKTMRLRIGTTTLTGTVVIGGDALPLNNASVMLECEIIRVTATGQHVGAARNSNDLTLYPPAFGFTGLSLTLASQFLIEATGENGTAAANDIVCQYLMVDLVTA